MRAFIIEKYGDNDEVKLATIDRPMPGKNDIVVQVKAASINPLDTRIRAGKLKQVLPYKMPLTLGNDFAGIVSSVGENVTKFNVGDEVYARCDTMRIGSFAEYIVCDAENVSLKPTNLSMEEAASLPLVGLTAWQILVNIADVQPGQKVLIHGGAGGVGSIAIQLAEHLGAYVATTAGKADFGKVTKLGANEVIDYKTQDFSEICKDYDLVLDTRGGETLEKSLHVLKRGGRVVSINGTPDANMASELGLNFAMKLIFTAMSLRTNQLAKKLGVTYAFHFMSPSGEQLDKLRALFESGTVKPMVDKEFAFKDTKKALAYSESGKSKGKVVVRI